MNPAPFTAVAITPQQLAQQQSHGTAEILMLGGGFVLALGLALFGDGIGRGIGILGVGGFVLAGIALHGAIS